MNSLVISGLASLAVLAAFVTTAHMLRRINAPAAISPVLATGGLFLLVLAATATPVDRFAALTVPLHLLLGPAIVALGAGVHGNRVALARAKRPLALAIIMGAITGVGSALALARALGLSGPLVAAILTRTVSTPFAVIVQTRVGGPVSLAAGITVIAGVIGAMLLPPLLARLGFRDPAAVGTATGVAAHIIGTDAVGRRDPVAGSFAGAAMTGTGMVVAVAVPPLWHLVFG